MADTISPWIASYLIEAAESNGAILSSIPFLKKGKKVQIIEFLTFAVENQDSFIWAKVSDKASVIPIRFSKESVAEYNKKSGKRLTELKSALVTIRKFRPMLSRPPLLGVQRVSKESHLVLECNEFDVTGSIGEPQWGTPRDIEAVKDIHQWLMGLRQDGGGGNVLKERREKREENGATKQDTGAPPVGQTTIQRPVVKKRAIVEALKPQTTTKAEQLRREYNRAWIEVIRHPLVGIRPDHVPLMDDSSDEEPATPPRSQLRPQKTPVKRRAALDLGTESPSEKASSPAREDSVPISDWAPTPEPVKVAKVEEESPSMPLIPSSSNPTAPTPAQRRRRPVSSSPAPAFRSLTFSDFPFPSHQTLATSTPAQRKMPQTPIPPPSSNALLPSGNMDTLLAPTNIRRVVTRKVPPPAQPPPPPAFITGPARILVPNSDTSGTTGTQSQPSQSLSLSQAQSQSQTQEDAVILSQLPELSGRRETEPFQAATTMSSQVSGHNSLFSQVEGDGSQPGTQESEGPARKQASSQSYQADNEGGEDEDEGESEPKAGVEVEKGDADEEIRDRQVAGGEDSHEHEENVEEPAEISEASMVAVQGTYQFEDSATEEDDELEEGKKVTSAEHDYEPQPTVEAEEHDSEDDKEAEELDEDDAMTQESLFGPSMRTLRRKAVEILPPIVPTPPPTPHSEVLSATPKPVEHDVQAWAAPSFIRNRNTGVTRKRPLPEPALEGNGSPAKKTKSKSERASGVEARDTRGNLNDSTNTRERDAESNAHGARSDSSGRAAVTRGSSIVARSHSWSSNQASTSRLDVPTSRSSLARSSPGSRRTSAAPSTSSLKHSLTARTVKESIDMSALQLGDIEPGTYSVARNPNSKLQDHPTNVKTSQPVIQKRLTTSPRPVKSTGLPKNSVTGVQVRPSPRLDLRGRTPSSGSLSNSRLGKRLREVETGSAGLEVQGSGKALATKKRRLDASPDGPSGAAYPPEIQQEGDDANENVVMVAARDVGRAREPVPTHGMTKLNGYAVELDCIPVKPGTFTWERLMDILLKTGMKRSEEREVEMVR